MKLIRQTAPPSAAQMALLLEADPDRRKINAYLQTGAFYVTEDGDGLVVVMPLAEAGVWEIKNIVLVEAARGQGKGKALLATTLAMLAAEGATAVEIGTGNSSLEQLALYQKAGFRIVGIVPDFFADYPEPIIENAIECKDMVRLRLYLYS